MVNSKLGKYIRTKRTEKGLSQGDLAKLLGYSSPQYISDWERGASGVPMKKLIAVARFLDIDHAELFDCLLEFSMEKLKADLNEDYLKLVPPNRTVRKYER